MGKQRAMSLCAYDPIALIRRRTLPRGTGARQPDSTMGGGAVITPGPGEAGHRERMRAVGYCRSSLGRGGQNSARVHATPVCLINRVPTQELTKIKVGS